ncbi:MAG: transglutaminase-like domain-containing protein [Anaerolineales bacterium]
MNGRKNFLLMFGAVLILILPAGCGAPALTPSATITPSPTSTPAIATGTPERTEHSLLIPVGRTAVVGSNAFRVMIDSEPFDPAPVYDGYGGYWIEVPYDHRENTKVVLRFTVYGEQKGLYHEENGGMDAWLSPSALVDSDDPILIEEAERLTAGGGTAVERARKIHEFVVGYLTFQPYGRHYLTSASDTYRMGYGTCVNFARLFVALGRAANVPARTVWGVTFNDGAYEHHHEWAEYMDDDGYWHPLDLSYTTSFELSDVNYLDLIYSSEENPLYERSTSESYDKDAARLIVYDTTAQPYDGLLGFTFVEDDFPESYVVENVFVLAELPDWIPQQVP